MKSFAPHHLIYWRSAENQALLRNWSVNHSVAVRAPEGVSLTQALSRTQFSPLEGSVRQLTVEGCYRSVPT